MKLQQQLKVALKGNPGSMKKETFQIQELKKARRNEKYDVYSFLKNCTYTCSAHCSKQSHQEHNMSQTVPRNSNCFVLPNKDAVN